MTGRLLIAGWGPIAQRHARNFIALQPQGSVTVVRAQAEPPGEAFPWAHRARSWEDALAGKPDVAVLASPATKRVACLCDLVDRGIPTLVEKPLAATLAEGVALDALRPRAPVLLGYNLRFHAALRSLREAVTDGRIGAPRYLRAEVGQYLPDWRPGRDYRTSASARAELGGGALRELSHEIDLALWLLGEPIEVLAWVGQLGRLGLDVEDTGELTIRFRNGALASVHLDFLQRVPRRRLSVAGDEATVDWDLGSERTWLWSPGREAETLADTRGADRNEMYLAEMSHFLECAAGKASPAVGIADGVRVLRVIEAARRSHEEGRRIAL